MSSVAGTFIPDFGVVGGDIAYGDGMYTCYEAWDGWLTDWEINVSNGGFLVPFILALGNHEAGGFHQPVENIPYYLTFFPQSLAEAQSTDVNIRKTFHAHKISDNTVFLGLDSLISTRSGSEQTEFITEQLGTTFATLPNKFALYHVVRKKKFFFFLKN
jgi:hypothetical protein